MSIDSEVDSLMDNEVFLVNLLLSASIFRFGPLVRQWTMRFEARHKYFKQLASKLGNFINITYTLASRHQQLQCYQHINSTSIQGEDIEFGPSIEKISPSQLPYCTLRTNSPVSR